MQTNTEARRRFAPRWPRTVAGRNWRPLLSNPEAERLARRMDALYSDAPLSDHERRTLLRAYEPIPNTAARLWLVGGPLARDEAFARAERYVTAIEAKYDMGAGDDI